MSSSTFGFLLAALVALCVLAVYEGFAISRLACQFFLGRLRPSFSPAGGSPAAAPPSKAGLAVHGHDLPSPEQPEGLPSFRVSPLSSPLPACCSTDLESVAVLPLTLAAIDPAPNLSAFTAGLELAVFTALFTIGALLAVNWIVKTMRSSNR